MKDKDKNPKPKKYEQGVLDCPVCGAHIEGDMPVITHAIMGCKPKDK